MKTSQTPYTRRYSNAAAAGGFTASAGSRAAAAGSYAAGSHTLDAEPENPAQGSVSFIRTYSSADPTLKHVTPVAGGLRGPDGAYPSEETFRVTAWPAAGYRFSHWTGDVPAGQGQANPLNIVLSKDVTLRAHFAAVQQPPTPPTQHRLTVNWNPERGTVTGGGLTGGQMTVGDGDTVTLTATPHPGYRFEGWQGLQLAGNMQTNKSHTITLTVSHDITLTASFVAEDNPGGGDPGNGDPGNGDPGNGGGNSTGGGTLDQAKAFARKWWWAILIAAYLIYKETKGKKK